ncbi:MAG: FAD-dependent oxidoreductase, partial [Paenisporosarcina sp.]
IPRNGKAYVGTTDTFFDEDPKQPIASKEDVDYLLEAIAFMFPKIKLTPNHVESTWAGVRPLIFEEGKDPSEISRKDEIWESKTGLITIAGGKLTGYRKMAETVVDLVARKLKGNYPVSMTKHLPLSGGDIGGSAKYYSFINMKIVEGLAYGLSQDQSKDLASFYGTNVDYLFSYANMLKTQKLSMPLVMAAKLYYGIYHEMVCTPSDFFIRRTGSLYFNIKEVEQYKEAVLLVMKDILGYTDEQVEYHRFELQHQLELATSFRSGESQ